MSLPKSIKKTLYCVAHEKFVNGRWVAEKDYLHDFSPGEARLQWIRTIPAGFSLGYNVKIVGVAPVIGGFAQDEHGDRIIL